MTDDYDYRPPFGLDIRIKPRTERKREATKRVCGVKGCNEPATCRVPAAPDRTQDFLWLCQAHAREHNQSWDFFRGKTDEEIAAFQQGASTGHRPTWAMGVNGWSRDGSAVERRRRSFRPGEEAPGRQSRPAGAGASGDPYDLFQASVQAERTASSRRPALSRLQRAALSDLGLEEDADMEAVKGRYKELVKRFHPDANGGDRGAEDSLRRVIRAYQTLKSSGLR